MVVSFYPVPEIYLWENHPKKSRDMCQHRVSFYELNLTDIPERFYTQTLEDMYGYSHPLFIESNIIRFRVWAAEALTTAAKYQFWRYRGFVHHSVTDFGMGVLPRRDRFWLGRRKFYMYFKGSHRALIMLPPRIIRATVEPRHDPNTPPIIMFSAPHLRFRSIAKAYAILFSQSAAGIGAYYRVTLELRGLGYKVFVPEPKRLEFKLGYSHMVVFKFKGSAFAKALGIKYRNFVIFAKDIVEVTAVAARVRGLRSINVYKGKGIFKKYFKYTKKISKRG